MLDEFALRLKVYGVKVLLEIAPGSAIGYCHNRWTKLGAFLLDGRTGLDCNRSERPIKPFVIDRRNWLFFNTPFGANVNDVIYSMVETANKNGVDPWAYMYYFFEQILDINGKDLDALEVMLEYAEPFQTRCRILAKTAG